MSSIDQIIYAQPVITPQVTGTLTNSRFWSVNVFVDYYYDYCCVHLIRGDSYEETLQAREAYECLMTTQE